ncbi:Uncharacterised protein [Mycobacteroides abscessus subsp. abscessus]|nr:Uncharacterised protein [Mycobacteroides abscessus subsp. abscessus]
MHRVRERAHDRAAGVADLHIRLQGEGHIRFFQGQPAADLAFATE